MDKRLEKALFGGGMWWWVRHSLFWLFMYLDQMILVFVVEQEANDMMTTFVAMLLDIATVYFNFYVLIPFFFKKKKYLTYVFLSILIVIINVVGYLCVDYLVFEDTLYIEDFVSSLIATFTLVASAIGLKIGKYYYNQLELTQELQSSQSKLELNALKEQINPHFLFNVLNTIHIQSMTDPSSVSETVLNLSELLRYQVYEASANEYVTLNKEIAFIKNYIALEKVRRKNLITTWNEPASIPKIKVTPFLFLPLIENALKHSKSLEEKESHIETNWTINEKYIELKVSNTIGLASGSKEGGFGIDNLKKRLELLYPGNYDFKMNSKDGIFYATLKIST